MRLHFEVDGESDKPPLLLVHGLLSSRRHWLPNFALADSFRLIRVELPAHGKSPPPISRESARPDALVDALDELRLLLGIERWNICGQSFGGAITLRYALRYSDVVIAQVFTNANSALRGDWTEEMKARRKAEIEDVRKLGPAGMRKMPYHPAHAKRFPPDIRAALAEDADSIYVDGFAMLLEEASPRLSVRDQFARTVPPTLLVNGRWEGRFQPLREWAAEELPSMQVVDLEGGHSINIECPDEFNSAVRTFLNARQAAG
jgi:2-succinyl-6-hydroxy-2,4-cyclohexadiene-1-carboxylate synthase